MPYLSGLIAYDYLLEVSSINYRISLSLISYLILGYLAKSYINLNNCKILNRNYQIIIVEK